MKGETGQYNAGKLRDPLDRKQILEADQELRHQMNIITDFLPSMFPDMSIVQ